MTYFPGLAGPLPDELIRLRHGDDEYFLDLVALTSNYQCIYGRGCQGTTPLRGEGPVSTVRQISVSRGAVAAAPASALGATPGRGRRPSRGQACRCECLPFRRGPDPGQDPAPRPHRHGRHWYQEDDGADAQIALMEADCIFLDTEIERPDRVRAVPPRPARRRRTAAHATPDLPRHAGGGDRRRGRHREHQRRVSGAGHAATAVDRLVLPGGLLAPPIQPPTRTDPCSAGWPRILVPAGRRRLRDAPAGARTGVGRRGDDCGRPGERRCRWRRRSGPLSRIDNSSR